MWIQSPSGKETFSPLKLSSQKHKGSKKLYCVGERADAGRVKVETFPTSAIKVSVELRFFPSNNALLKLRFPDEKSGAAVHFHRRPARAGARGDSFPSSKPTHLLFTQNSERKKKCVFNCDGETRELEKENIPNGAQKTSAIDCQTQMIK